MVAAPNRLFEFTTCVLDRISITNISQGHREDIITMKKHTCIDKHSEFSLWGSPKAAGTLSKVVYKEEDFPFRGRSLISSERY
jgi:hypothetical protein